MLCHFAECHYGECRDLFTVMLSVTMLIVVMLSVVVPKIVFIITVAYRGTCDIQLFSTLIKTRCIKLELISCEPSLTFATKDKDCSTWSQ